MYVGMAFPLTSGQGRLLKRRCAPSCGARLAPQHQFHGPAIAAKAHCRSRARSRAKKPKSGKLSLRAISAELAALGVLNERARSTEIYRRHAGMSANMLSI
jgi:hypothetical protein